MARPRALGRRGDVEAVDADIDGRDDGLDLDALYRQAAIEHLRSDEDAQVWFRDRGGAAPWMAVQSSLMKGLPEGAVADPNAWAHELVPTALDAVFGASKWNTEKRPKRDDLARNVTWVVLANQ